jgi:serine/threonine protein kinase
MVEEGEGVVVTGPAAQPGRYRVTGTSLERSEVGGEGIVYRAVDSVTGRDVALKQLTTVSPADFEALAERAGSLVEVSHPHLMRQLAVFLGAPLGARAVLASSDEEFDIVYTVAGWVSGQTLTEAADGSFGQRECGWLVDIAAALTHLHGVRTGTVPGGFVHRDVKPSNIRIDEDGSAVLLDYGVTRPVVGSGMTEGVGTYRWRAPEVFGGGTGSSRITADAWGLGAVAYWLLVGEPPSLDGIDPTRTRLLAAARRAGVADPVAVADRVCELLDPSPARRPADLRRWADDLADAVEYPRSHRHLRTAIRRAPLVLLDALLLAWVWGMMFRLPTREAKAAALLYATIGALLLARTHVGQSHWSLPNLVGQMALRLSVSLAFAGMFAPQAFAFGVDLRADVDLVVGSLIVLLIPRAVERIVWWWWLTARGTGSIRSVDTGMPPLGVLNREALVSVLRNARERFGLRL